MNARSMVRHNNDEKNSSKSPDVAGTLALRSQASHIGSMLHLVKLAVGIRDVAHLTQVQAARAQIDPPLRHQTRQVPRRAAEILDGGSIYWVIAGAVVVRQRITDIIEDRRDDATKCAGLVLDPLLVPVSGTKMRPFQGWRYLAADVVPPDLDQVNMVADEMPASLRRALQDLALL